MQHQTAQAFVVSVAPPSKINTHGISSPPCIRSSEQHLDPVTWHIIDSPRCRYKEQTEEIFFGMWPTTIPSFITAWIIYYLQVCNILSMITATAKASTRLPASLSHGRCPCRHCSLSPPPQPKNSLDHQPYLTRVSSASSTEVWQHDTLLRGMVNSLR